MISVGKTTATSNNTQGPSRGFRDVHQAKVNLTGPTGYRSQSRPALHPWLHQCIRSRTSCMRFRRATRHSALSRAGEKELEETPESTTTTTYGAYIMDIGFQDDAVELNMALAVCLLGYGEVGRG